MSSLPQNRKSAVGRRFSCLVVISTFKERYTCQCDCGNTVVVDSSNLYKGFTKSCGCKRFAPETYHVRKEVNALRRIAKRKERKFRHPRIFQVWKNMLCRCNNPKVRMYKWYGARGISVCDEWAKNYFAFQDWARKNGYRRGLQLDRTENDGHYTPDNCRFVTAKVNQNNRRKPAAHNRKD
jgi:hypothetical protein